MSSTKEKLLQAALDEFSANGYVAATTRAIADKAGFREVTLFRHFGSKENLLKALLEQKSVMPSSLQLFDNASELTVEKLLFELGHRFYTQLLDREKLVRLLVLEAHSRPEIRDQLGRVPAIIHDQLSRYLADMMREGKVRKGDPKLLALAFLSLFFSLVIGKDFMDTGGRSPEEVTREFVNVFVSGIML